MCYWIKGSFTRCDDIKDTVLIENKGVTPEWVATPIEGVSLVSSQHCHSVEADSQCKWVLRAYSHQVKAGVKAKKIKEHAKKDQRNFSLSHSLLLGLNTA